MTQEIKTCILCKASRSRIRFEKHGFIVLQCEECSLQYLDFVPDLCSLENLYSKDYYRNELKPHGYSDYFAGEYYLKSNFLRRAKIMERWRPSGRALDIGCGPGFFLETLGAHWEKYGVEVSPYICEAAKKRGLNVVRGEFSSSMFERGFFDLVGMWNILEHFNDPLEALKGVNRVMKTGGILGLYTGNVESLFARLCGKYWHLFLIPEHTYYFSPSTLRRVLREAGFEIMRIKSDPNWFSVDYLIERTFKMFGAKFDPKKWLGPLRPLFNKVLLPINLFDIMTVYAVKIND